MENLKKEEIYEKILIIIFVLAVIARILFVSFSTIDKYQNDMGIFPLKTSEDYEKLLQKDPSMFLKYRHLDYILTIHDTGKLPEVNNSQFYQPPLYHIISAIWLKIMDVLPLSAQMYLESLQIVTCIYSIITLIIILKILNELEIKSIYKIIVIAICGFHPLFIYMSGAINNDTLLTMFSILSILYIIKWYKNSNYKNAIILALIIGLGTLVKSSMLVNIVVAGIAFFIKLLETLYKEEYKKIKALSLQALLFFIISMPLIFSFSIRNYILFRQDFFCIHDAYESLYVGNDNPLERFGIFSKELFNNEIKEKDRNIVSYVVKSALVFNINVTIVSGTTFVKILSIFFICMTIISIISLMFSKNRYNLILIITYFSWLLSFIVFNIKMPNSCSMHARYIVTPMVISIILLAKFLEKKESKKLNKTIAVTTFLFCISSAFIVFQSVLQNILS